MFQSALHLDSRLSDHIDKQVWYTGTNYALDEHEDLDNIHVAQVQYIICEYVMLQLPCKCHGFELSY